MTRLIDADELKKALNANCENLCPDKNTNWCEHCCPHNEFEDLIDNAPTVEREPFATVTFDKDELDRIVDERVIEPIKNGELVIKEKRPTGRLIINYEAFVEDVENRLEHNRCPKEYAQGSRDTLEVAKLFIWKEAENDAVR